MKTLILILISFVCLNAQTSKFLLLLDNDRDVTPPSVPQNLLAVGGADKITLTWDANTETDLAGYVVYRDSLGNELVTNGGFDSDVSWIKNTGTTISGGTANIDGTSSFDNLYQQIGGAGIPKKYRIIYSILNYTSGTVTPHLGGATEQGTLRSANGTYTEIINFSALNNGNLVFDKGSGGTIYIGSLDNVSTKEIITSTSHPDIPIDTVLAGTESYVDTPLTSGTIYYYRLKALDNSGNLSAYTSTVSDTAWSR